jgi:hypothetical protein
LLKNPLFLGDQVAILMSVLALPAIPQTLEPSIVSWDGNGPPNRRALNVLASRTLASAAQTLGKWRDASAGCAIVVALPHTEKTRVTDADADLDGVAVVFPRDGENPVAFVQRTIDEVSPGTVDHAGGERDAPNGAGVLTELLQDDYGLGPRAKAAWIDALKNHGSDV